ncbi:MULTISPECIES: hypothetical protein [Roseivirga]|jgi:hypothetical protein|uniref:hypothetical protein n=1 Tax=Roseivirga TaxID=290180 RepID=UPI00257E83BC|nr:MULTISPECIES: hypothetical protein [Roseivirga]MEC7755080.1 type 1 periplasmic binding fold superfamily protein [Bacteroidota bacterium]|tara:strand:+ start:5447 stop:6013 length:567 start_codon:yes stop_codon:yes gene_type:complete
MKNITTIKSFLMAFLLLGLMACDNDDPEPVNEEELITTVRVTFTPSGGGSAIVATFQDLDGEGGNAPVITNPTLAANTTYSVSVEFLNESETPTEDITEEVEEEAEEHQVFFVAASGLNFTYAYNDEDGNGKPLGLMGTATTGDASNGTLTVLLIHEPNKSASGVSAGDPTNAGGEEDVRVNFSVTIQ